MAMWRKHFPQRGTDLAAASAVSVTMLVTVACAVVVSVVCAVWVGFVGHSRRPFARAGVGAAMEVSGCRVVSSAASR